MKKNDREICYTDKDLTMAFCCIQHVIQEMNWIWTNTCYHFLFTCKCSLHGREYYNTSHSPFHRFPSFWFNSSCFKQCLQMKDLKGSPFVARAMEIKLKVRYDDISVAVETPVTIQIATVHTVWKIWLNSPQEC